jgi:microcompartment protein CcmL/EutN
MTKHRADTARLAQNPEPRTPETAMAQQALGMIETKGLIGAVEAADAALKAADVKFVRYDKPGSAYVAITLTGDVAAVKAAVDAGAEAARKVGEVLSVHVIARPHDDVAKL